MYPGRNSSSIIAFVILFNTVVCSLILTENIIAVENPEKRTDNWKIRLSLSPFYDSNILKYSAKYIERFKNHEDEGRFHIDRIDDLVLGYSIGITYTAKIIGDQSTVIGAGIDSDAYTYNSIKTWLTYDIFWRQYISGSTSFLLSYSYIPKFYVRHFRDEDWVRYYGYIPETFKPFDFSKDDFSFWAQHIFSWKTSRLRIYFSYMRYFLNESNTEYDSNDYLYGLRLFQSLTRNINVSIGYYYVTSDAKGFDEPGESRETSDDSDATNYEHVYIAGIKLKLPEIFSINNEISVDAQYQRAFYTTNHFLELDPLHAGRYDYNYRVFFNYSLEVFNDFSLTAFYHWMGRESGTSAEANREYVSNEKDYTQYRLGIKLNYDFSF